MQFVQFLLIFYKVFYSLAAGFRLDFRRPIFIWRWWRCFSEKVAKKIKSHALSWGISHHPTGWERRGEVKITYPLQHYKYMWYICSNTSWIIDYKPFFKLHHFKRLQLGRFPSTNLRRTKTNQNVWEGTSSKWVLTVKAMNPNKFPHFRVYMGFFGISLTEV